MKTIKGWKITDSEMKCRGFQFEIGKRYKHEGKIKLCKSGFHFHAEAKDLFTVSYDFDSKNRVFEVIAHGKVKSEDKKSVTDDIEFIKELSWTEVLSIVNMGKDNTGRLNTGDMNTGDMNTGDRNTGDMNTGYRNTGYMNTGNMNTGYRNTGYRNTGYMNTGDRNTGNMNTGNMNTGNMNTGDMNTGDRNTGDYNSCNSSTGIFNTEEQTILMFNKPSNWYLRDWYNSKANLLLSNLILTEWVYFSDMTNEEKKADKNAYLRDGYLKTHDYKDAFKKMWNGLSKDDKKEVMTLPNFDKDIFFEITGVRL